MNKPPREPNPVSEAEPQNCARQLQKAAQDVLDAIDAARDTLEDARTAYESAMDDVECGLETLREVQSEYQDRCESLRDILQDGPLGEQLQAIIDIDLNLDPPDFEEPDLSAIAHAAQECLDADLPLDSESENEEEEDGEEA
jgi:hypothetical protein